MKLKTMCLLGLLGFSACKNNVLENSKNIHKVKYGMTMREVDSIMGAPIDTIFSQYDTDRFRFEYKSSFMNSSNYTVYFNYSDSLVTAIGYGG